MSDFGAFREHFLGFFRNRFRLRDLPLIVPIGVGFWFVNAITLLVARRVLDVPDSSGVFGASFLLNPSQIVVGALSGILFTAVIAVFQVDEPGIPEGLTLKQAFVPTVMMAVFAIGAIPLVLKSSNSALYAGIVVAINLASTSAASLLLRSLRPKG